MQIRREKTVYKGAVPELTLSDGSTVCQSMAIARWAARMAGPDVLYPSDATAALRVDEIMTFQEEVMGKSTCNRRCLLAAIVNRQIACCHREGPAQPGADRRAGLQGCVPFAGRLPRENRRAPREAAGRGWRDFLWGRHDERCGSLRDRPGEDDPRRAVYVRSNGSGWARLLVTDCLCLQAHPSGVDGDGVPKTHGDGARDTWLGTRPQLL